MIKSNKNLLKIQEFVEEFFYTYFSEIKEIYCVCYNNNGDKRILIYHGIFLEEDTCIDYVNELNKVSNVKYSTCKIKVNKNSIDYNLDKIEAYLDYFEDITNQMFSSLTFDYKESEEMIALENAINFKIMKDVKKLIHEGFEKDCIISNICDDYPNIEKEKLFKIAPILDTL